MDDLIEKSAMRKIYLRLLPFAIISYFLAYIDRINVSFAALTMRDDLGISASAYGFALGTFYWGYFLFEVPSNVILERVGARTWIARSLVTWGNISGCTACVVGEYSVIALRFRLGLAEAGFVPGIILYPNCWFPAVSRSRSTAAVMGAIPSANDPAAMYAGPATAEHADWAARFAQDERPQLVLLASLDVARMQMATDGERLLAGVLALARDARRRRCARPRRHRTPCSGDGGRPDRSPRRRPSDRGRIGSRSTRVTRVLPAFQRRSVDRERRDPRA